MKKVNQSTSTERLLDKRRKGVLLMTLMYGIATIDSFIVIYKISAGHFELSRIIPLILVPLFMGLILNHGVTSVDKELKGRLH